jgi:hypothetical protein
MDSELLSYLYHRLLHSPSARVESHSTYSNGLIALMFLHAASSDRSPHWACRRGNWPIWCQRLRFPSYSQFMRRLKSNAVSELIRQVNDESRARLPQSHEKFLDGKPLTVGGFTKDPDARRGHVPDGWAKGYKVHALVDAGGAIDAVEVTALNVGEPTVARRLIKGVDLHDVLIRADSNYDSNALYAEVADQGGRLLAPRKKPGTGLGHHPNHADRLRAIAELETDATGRKAHNHIRARVERSFARLTNLPYGLSPLPNFVRRLERVTRWVTAKITLYHVYCTLSQNKRLAA